MLILQGSKIAGEVLIPHPHAQPITIRKRRVVKAMQPVAYEGHPRRNLIRLMTVTALLASATATMASPAQGRRHVAHRWHGYGFLPGYRSPERIEWERARNRGPTYWYGGPGFYRRPIGNRGQARGRACRP